MTRHSVQVAMQRSILVGHAESSTVVSKDGRVLSMRKLLLIVAGPVVVVGSLQAQRPFRISFQPGGRFVATNVTLRMLIGAAYGTPQPLPDFQMTGGPKWLDTDRFDVTAKAAGDPAPGLQGPPPTMFLMLQSMLEERFKLHVHYEVKD